ncbi:tetratricopeptide repeat protein [uncultured Thiodictyon sp.]|uniref:tetratricopeptide repeat protein n=1 Tax=uncultured Thiodictyon sp. TaxID=1846217 RepID=UPI0025E0CEDD|nr:tetratricopeptide repeat protein [uncultured Thiodictyon sp.]
MAFGYLQDAFAIRQEIGDCAGEGVTLNSLSQIHLVRGELNRALDLLQCALAIQQEIGDRAGEATTLNSISQIHDFRGDLEQALEYLKRSLPIRTGEGVTLCNIATIHQDRGDSDQAFDLLRRSLAIYQEIGYAAGQCMTRTNIGLVQWEKGEPQEALKTWTLAYRQARSHGLAEALQALERLAPQIGLSDGLAGWESVARRTPMSRPFRAERVMRAVPGRCPGLVCHAPSGLYASLKLSGDTALRCHPCVRRSAPGVPAPVPEPLAPRRCQTLGARSAQHTRDTARAASREAAVSREATEGRRR